MHDSHKHMGRSHFLGWKWEQLDAGFNHPQTCRIHDSYCTLKNRCSHINTYTWRETQFTSSHIIAPTHKEVLLLQGGFSCLTFSHRADQCSASTSFIVQTKVKSQCRTTDRQQVKTGRGRKVEEGVVVKMEGKWCFVCEEERERPRGAA